MNRQLAYIVVIVVGLIGGFTFGCIVYLLFFAGGPEKEFDPSTVRPAVEKGQWVAPKDEVAEKYRKMLSDGTNPEKINAAAELGDLRDVKSLPQLLKLMEDPDVMVRGKAGVAVRKIIDTDFNFNADAPPAERAQKLSIIKGFAEHMAKELPNADSKFKPKQYQGK